MKIIENVTKRKPDIIGDLKFGEEFYNSSGDLCIKVNNLHRKAGDDACYLVKLDSGELHQTVSYYQAYKCKAEISVLEMS